MNESSPLVLEEKDNPVDEEKVSEGLRHLLRKISKHPRVGDDGGQQLPEMPVPHHVRQKRDEQKPPGKQEESPVKDDFAKCAPCRAVPAQGAEAREHKRGGNRQQLRLVKVRQGEALPERIQLVDGHAEEDEAQRHEAAAPFAPTDGERHQQNRHARHQTCLSDMKGVGHGEVDALPLLDFASRASNVWRASGVTGSRK